MDQRALRLTRARVVSSVMSLGVLAASARGISQQSPVTPGAIVRGRLVAGDTNQPFRDATVILQPVGSQVSPPSREALDWMEPGGQPVDADGRFEIPSVSEGSYRLVATPFQTARRYVQSFYPEAWPEGSRYFTVSSDQGLEDIVVLVHRGAAISGRVLDENGMPQSNVTVNVHESLAAGRTRGPASVAPSLGPRTDDNGSFRLFGLQAGEYIVVAQPPPVPAGRRLGPPRPAVYPLTYYPDAFSPSEALRLRLRPGDDYGPIEIVLRRSRLLTIRGLVTDANGAPVARALVRLQKATLPILNDVGPGMIPTSVDGTFELNQVPPGEYALTTSRYGGAFREFAWTAVSVAGNMDGVMLTLRPAVDVEGQVIFDTPPTGSLASLRIKPVEGPGASKSPAIQVKDDGSFSLEHLFGPVLIRTEGWKGWHVRSVLYGGRDITDEPTELARGVELRVHLADRLGTLAGLVTSERGNPVTAAVVIFSEDPSFRHEQSTMTRVVHAGPNGRYVVEGLRAGRYLVVAVPREAGPTDVSADYFELLSKDGRAVTIRERERETLDLRLLPVR